MLVGLILFGHRRVLPVRALSRGEEIGCADRKKKRCRIDRAAGGGDTPVPARRAAEEMAEKGDAGGKDCLPTAGCWLLAYRKRPAASSYPSASIIAIR